MGEMASQITSLTIIYSTVHWGADQRKHQSFTSLAFVRGIHRWSVNSPHKWPVARKMLPSDDVIIIIPTLPWSMCDGGTVRLTAITQTAQHGDVIKRKQFPRYWPFVRGIHRSPVNSRHKGQWRGALMLFINLRLNKRLRCHCAHYDVTVMDRYWDLLWQCIHNLLWQSAMCKTT